MEENNRNVRQERVAPPFRCYAQGWRVPVSAFNPHQHRHIELIYISKGSRSYTALLNGSEHEVPPGSLLVISADMIHGLHPIGGGPHFNYVCQFLPELLYSGIRSESEVHFLLPFFRQDSGAFRVIPAERVDSSPVGDLFLRLKEDSLACERGEYTADFRSRIHLCQLTLWVLEVLHGVMEKLPTEIKATHIFNLLRVIERLNTDYTAELSAADAAKDCFMSYSTFAPLFRYLTGRSFKQYLTDVRMMHAKNLLFAGDLSVTEIGAAVGYSTTSYFIRQFRLSVGMPPSRYRRQILDSENNG